ncbi:putative endochitinase [Ordospora pajunii]|uniref:putative endochitinase n=1 Tax=Ordospora pajunii TaxID=3039483 RepID=UPI0029528ACE|nr:putative endochitinase [Ordospora pajunii]KAH9412014.1 putative endochitinase [Ordospora pajunii]
MLLLLAGIALVNAKNSCVPGSAECVGNTLRVCGMNKQWAVIDCPADSKCKVVGENVTCASKSKNTDDFHQKHDLNSHPSDAEPDSEVANQDYKHDDRNSEHEKNRSNANDLDNDDSQANTKENGHDDQSHENTKDEEDANNRDNDIPRPARNKRLGTKHNVSPRLRSNTRTITRTIYNGGEPSTVTITKMIVQKQAPSEIKLEYVSNQVEPSVRLIDQSTTPPSQPSLPSSNNQNKGNAAEPSTANLSAPNSTGSMSQQPSAPVPSTPSQQPSVDIPSQPASPNPVLTQPTSNSNTSQPAPSTPNPPSQSTPSTSDSKSSMPDASSSNGTSTSKPSTPSSGGNVNITSEKLIEELKKLSFAPNPEFVDAVVSRVNSKFTELNNAVMFLSQCAHESGGYQYIEEIACAGGTSCAGQYGTGASGKSYHGRGFIQLSWPDNYKAASQALGLGDELYENPDKVAQDPNLGADVSIYFWKENVENAPGVKENHYGSSTKAINGALECTGSNIDKSKRRFEIYTALVKAFSVSNPADESGCYN